MENLGTEAHAPLRTSFAKRSLTVLAYGGGVSPGGWLQSRVALLAARVPGG